MSFYKKCVIAITILVMIACLFLSLITGSRVFVALGVLIAGVVKLFINHTSSQKKSNVLVQNNSVEVVDLHPHSQPESLWKKTLARTDFLAILLGIITAFFIGLFLVTVGILLLSPSAYFYLGEDSYEQSAFPVWLELASGIAEGLAGGWVTSLHVKSMPLVKSISAGIIFLGISYLISDAPKVADPLWFTILGNILPLTGWIGGALLSIYSFTQKKTNDSISYGTQPTGKKIVYSSLALIIILFVALSVTTATEQAPPKAIMDQLENLAAGGDDNAERRLGDIYYHGRNIPKNLPKAAQLYQQAAMQGNAIAQDFLGWMYSKGEGVEKNKFLAYTWLALAHKNGMSMFGALSVVKNSLTPDEILKADKWVAEWNLQPKH